MNEETLTIKGAIFSTYSGYEQRVDIDPYKVIKASQYRITCEKMADAMAKATNHLQDPIVRCKKLIIL